MIFYLLRAVSFGLVASVCFLVLCRMLEKEKKWSIIERSILKAFEVILIAVFAWMVAVN